MSHSRQSTYTANSSALYAAAPATKPDYLLNETELSKYLQDARTYLEMNAQSRDAAREVVRYAFLLGVVLRRGHHGACINMDAGIELTKYAAQIASKYKLQFSVGYCAIGWCYENAINPVTGESLALADNNLALAS